MPLWKRFWLLGTVIWVVVCVLNAATILAFSEGEADKALQPLALAVAVPLAAYALIRFYLFLRRK